MKRRKDTVTGGQERPRGGPSLPWICRSAERARDQWTNAWKLKKEMDEARMGRHESVFLSILIIIIMLRTDGYDSRFCQNAPQRNLPKSAMLGNTLMLISPLSTVHQR